MTLEQVSFIRNSDLSLRKLGKMFGVDGKTVHAVKRGHTWR